MESERRIIVVDPEEFTKYEIARVLGARALQISMGAPILVKIENIENKSFLEIAEIEMKEKVLPITVIRVLPKKEENE